MNLGSISASEALGLVAKGAQSAADSTALVDTPQDNGYPGFDTIWAGIWGAVKGIVTAQPNIATVNPPKATTPAGLPLATLAVVGVGAFLLLKTRRTPRSRYRRMKARR